MRRNPPMAALNVGAILSRKSVQMIVQAFFDESGKFNDKSVISFCGFAATPEAMAEFSKEWEGMLRRIKLHGSLSMKQAMRVHVPLSELVPAQSVSERIEVLKPFASCIHKYMELGIGMSINVAGFNELPQHVKNIYGANPQLVAFGRTIQEVMSYTRDEDHIAVICDEEEGVAEKCLNFYRRIKLAYGEEQRAKLASLTFADDEVYPPLQAADMLSSLIRMEAEKKFSGKEYDFEPLYKFIRSPRPGELPLDINVCFLGKEDLRRLGDGYIELQKLYESQYPGKKLPPLTISMSTVIKEYFPNEEKCD